jgi:hypothetical protein
MCFPAPPLNPVILSHGSARRLAVGGASDDQAISRRRRGVCLIAFVGGAPYTWAL